MAEKMEFVIFCIENVAQRLHMEAPAVYAALKEKNLIAGYLIPNYEVLHTQGKDYIVDDVIDAMREDGALV